MGLFSKVQWRTCCFCNLGQVNEDLERLLESLCTGSVDATSKLRSWTSSAIHGSSHLETICAFSGGHVSLHLPYRWEVVPMVYDVIEVLELERFPVISITSDGNSPNQQFYHICHLSNERPTYKTSNPFGGCHDIFVTHHIYWTPQGTALLIPILTPGHAYCGYV